MFNKIKNTMKRAGAATSASARGAALRARAVYDKMRQGKTAPAVAPTPYLDNNSRRIYKTNNGAVFSQDAAGNKNYTPIAGAIKNGANAPQVGINTMNLKTVPANIRPTNNVAKVNSPIVLNANGTRSPNNAMKA
jgi:hypothetical protein